MKKRNKKHYIMRPTRLKSFIPAICAILSPFLLQAQERERIGGYVNFASDNQQEWVNQIFSVHTDNPAWNMLESPFKDSLYNWGEVVAGTWVENEYYLVTNLVRGGVYYVGNYMAYEPLTQTYRFIDKSAGLLPSNSADMTYNPVTKELFAITRNNELIKMSLTDSSSEMIGTITENGLELQNNPFRTLACNNEGVLYSFNDNGSIYIIDPATAKAERAGFLDQNVGVFSQSATFSPATGKCYWNNSGGSSILYEVNIQTGETKQITATPGLAGLFVFHYPGGAPARPVSDLRMVKNPSDYTKATFIFSVPALDLMDEPIPDPVSIEVWKGSSEKDMEQIGLIENVNPGSNQTYTVSESQGTAYYAFRVRNKSGLCGPFAGLHCTFFNVSFPYHTSFEPEEGTGNIISIPGPTGNGWSLKSNTSEYTLVHSGTYAYGIDDTPSKNGEVDNESILRLSGFNVYAHTEYELAFYAAGYNAYWDYVMSTQWYEAPSSPLTIRMGDTTYRLELNPEGGKNGYDTMTGYSFRFIPGETGEISIEFQTQSPDDAYFIDDLSVTQITENTFPAAIEDLELSNPDHTGISIDIALTAPGKTQDGKDLAALDGIILQASRFSNFINNNGEDDFICDTLKNIDPGQETSATFDLGQEGFWYVRAYAYNKSGMSISSETKASGYIGNGYDLTFNIRDLAGRAIPDAALRLSPLFPESAKVYDTASDANGNLTLASLYAGNYEVAASARPLYDDTVFAIELKENTAIDIVLADHSFRKQPQGISDLAVAETDHSGRKVTVSWTNPSLDSDGNTLESLQGIVFAYSLNQGEYHAADTVEEPQIGLMAETTLALDAQGYCSIMAYAFNEHGNSDTSFLDAGYVGNGFNLQVHCTNANRENLSNVHVVLVSRTDDSLYAANSDENGIAEIRGLHHGAYTLQAIADYHDRTIWNYLMVENDIDTAIRLNYTLQAPEITRLEVIEPSDARIDWSVKENRNFHDGFESYPDWEIEEIGDYSLYGAKNKGYFGGLSFPNMQMAYAYLVFNPSAATPSVENDPYWTTHSGKKMLISAFSLKNDDWLIHSVDGGGTLSFFATGAEVDGSGPERFQVLYSSTDDNPGNFTMVSEGDYVETTTSWTEYSYKLPDNARYFAIHCVSEDASLFKLDDISYTLDYGAKIAQATGYELYLNGELLRSVPATDSSFTFEDLPDGMHNLGLRALYEEGASDIVTRTVTIGYEVPAPVNLQAHNTDTGWLLTWDMPGESNAQYYKVFCDGEFVINTQYKQWFLGELQVNEGHYAGVCAVINEYFSDTVYTKFGESANDALEAGPKVGIYPNPARSMFHIETGEACHASIFSADGKKILSRELTAGKHEFSLEGQTKGIYLISIETAGGTVFRKLILQ